MAHDFSACHCLHLPLKLFCKRASALVQKTNDMIVEIHPSLTPIDSESFPSYLPCFPILYQRLQSLLDQSSWEIPKPFTYITDHSPLSSSSTQIAVDCFTRITKGTAHQKKRAPKMLHQRSTTDSISGRLPVRSKATIHRLNSVSIAHRLPLRAVNSKTQHRMWKLLERH